MKPSTIFVIALLIALGLLQYKLWFSEDGAPQYWRLTRQVTAMNADNAKLQARNTRAIAEIENLKNGNEAIEERARNDLGLVKPTEIFYQIVQ